MTPPLSSIGLGEVLIGQRARIIAINTMDANRYLQMGFLEGALVQVIHETPFGGDAIAVRVRGTLIALRRNDANFIQVILES